MKLRKILILFILFFCITFTSCDLDDIDINIDNGNSSSVQYSLDTSLASGEIEISQFDISDIKIVAEYSNNLKGSFDASEAMLSDEDLAKLGQIGTHTITVNYKDWSDTFNITLIANKIIDNSEDKESDDPAPEPDEPSKDVVTYCDSANYYKDAVGKSGKELKLALRTITTSGYKSVSYKSLNTYLAKTDASPNNPNKLLLFYLRKEVSNTWDGGTTWNKEHVWPRSQGWFQYEGAGCDAHHIRAVDSSENSTRGNKPYGVGNGYYTPSDEVKGDVARIIFYLLVRYEEADSYSVTKVAQSMDMLLEWNALDPVDDIERARNEAVYKIQNNRNPFIDYSDYAYYIWDTSYLTQKTSSETQELPFVNLSICFVYKKNETVWY